MVNIDPSGYMYLARFESMVGERTFTMLPVKRDEAGNPMLASASAAEIQEGNIPSDATYFALDRERGQYYLVNADGVAIGADGAPVSDDARYIRRRFPLSLTITIPRHPSERLPFREIIRHLPRRLPTPLFTAAYT